MASYFSLVSKYIEFSNTRTPGKTASMSSHALKTSPRAFAYLRMVSEMSGCRSQEDEVPDRLVNQLNSSGRPFARTSHSARSPDSRFPTVGPSNILAKYSICSLPRVSICCRNGNHPFGSKSTEVASASKRAEPHLKRANLVAQQHELARVVGLWRNPLVHSYCQYLIQGWPIVTDGGDKTIFAHPCQRLVLQDFLFRGGPPRITASGVISRSTMYLLTHASFLPRFVSQAHRFL